MLGEREHASSVSPTRPRPASVSARSSSSSSARHRVPLDPVEEPQRPRVLREQPAAPEPVPDLHRAADELVAAGPLHAVDAQVRAADADRVLRRPGARRVVLGGHQPVPRVERRGDRRAQVDVAEPEHQVLRRRRRSADTSSRVSRPLIRRMNSMFHGHQGASSRTPAMYRSIASRVAGSSQDSGSRTRPRRHDQLRVGGQVVLELAQQPGHAVGLAARAASVCTCSDRMPGVTSRIPARGPRLPARCMQRVHPHPQGEVELLGAVLDEHVVVAVAPVGDRRAVRRPRLAAGQITPSSPSPPPGQRPGGSAAPRRAAAASASRTGHEPHGVARPQLAELPELAARDDGRADEAAEARPVGPEDDRGVAGEVERTDRVRGVVDVGRVQPGLAAVRPRPRRASARSAARRCAPS